MIIYLLLSLLVKHYIIDFPLQTPYQYLNKGKLGHFGGILHALLHGISTFCILCFFSFEKALFLSLVDAILHYFIDWLKVNLTKKYKWSYKENEKLIIVSNSYFIALGFDQLLHSLTYCLIVFLA